MTQRLRNITNLTQTVTVVRSSQTVAHTVFPLNYLLLSDVEYAAISPPLVAGVWEVTANPPDVTPAPPVIAPDVFTTDDLPEGALNKYFTESRARSASVEDLLVDGALKAPTQNAVYDALLTKVETASNVGTGVDLFKQKTGTDLEFKKIYAGAGISITPFATEVEIAATGGGGGTSIGGSVTGGTPGSVLFVDSSGNLAQDNGSLFWDASIQRLGIGISSPARPLQVFGIGQFGVGTGAPAVTSSWVVLNGDGSTDQGFVIATNATPKWYLLNRPGDNFLLSTQFIDAVTVTQGGLFGIGTTPASTLDVLGGGEFGTGSPRSSKGADWVVVNGSDSADQGFLISHFGTDLWHMLDRPSDSHRFCVGIGPSDYLTIGTTGTTKITPRLVVDSVLYLTSGPGGGNTTGLQSSASQTVNIVYTFPLVDGAAGTFLQTDGAGNLIWAAAGGGGGGWTTSVKNTAYTAVNNDEIFADSTGAGFAIDLPATPTVGWRVRVADYAGTWGTNNVTLGRNGENINGVASDFTLNVNNGNVEAVYVDVTQGWKVLV